MSESIPRYMLLDENSEEMRDRRILPVTDYRQQGDKAVVIKKNVIYNTIPLSWKLSNKSSIYNLQYSSKYGVLLVATDNEVAIKTTAQLEEDLISGKHNDKASMSIKFSGELFFSPDEEILAVCSESLIQFVKTASLKKPNNIEAPPSPNLNESNHYLWVDNSHFLGWKFEGGALLYTLDPQTLKIKNEENLSAECCTGASVIHGHLFLMEKLKVTIYEPFSQAGSVIKSEIDMTDPDHESPSFQYSYLIDIFKINFKDETFTPNDVFGLIAVYYDEDEDDVDQRFLTFAKGNIFDRGSLEIRGFENFYSAKTTRQLFYINEQDKQKASFSIKRVIASGFICIMIEKCEKVYVIDPLEDFQRINIYDIKSKHELKHGEGKFLQGMALMKNMLKIERTIPNKAEDLLKEVVTKYNGEFMSLYFKDKESNLTIAFPSSLLVIGGDKMYRRYAVNTVDAIDDDSNDLILEKVSKIKKSPHILGDNQLKRFSEKTDKKQAKEEKKQEQKQEPPKVEQPSIFAAKPLAEPAKTEKKEQQNQMANLFRAKPVGTAQSAATLFGKPPPSAQTTSIFGYSDVNLSKKTETNLFGKKDEPKSDNFSSIFAPTGASQTSPNIFDKAKLDAAPKQLFPGVPNLFDRMNVPLAPIQPVSSENKQAKPAATNIFGKKEQAPLNTGFGGINLGEKSQPKQSDGLKSMFGSFFGKAQEIRPASITIEKKQQPAASEAAPELNRFTLGSAQPSTGLLNGLFANKNPQEEKSQAGVKIQTNILGSKALDPSPPTAAFNNFSFAANVAKDQEKILKAAKAQQPKLVAFLAEKTQSQALPPFVPPFVPTSNLPSTALNNKQEKKSQDAPKEPEKAVEKPSQAKKKFLLALIKSKVSDFVSFQKQLLNPQSKASDSFELIKKVCNKQEQTLKSLDNKIFGQSLEEIRATVESSIVSSPKLSLILSNQSEETQETEERFNSTLKNYEQQSHKMIYYINLLGKKKPVNLRASLSQSRSFQDKAVANFRRITQQFDKKVSDLQTEAVNVESLITSINYSKASKRNKKKEHKKKVFNFQQFDQEQEKVIEKPQNSQIRKIQSNAVKSEVKPATISLSNLYSYSKPKIVLMPSESTYPEALKQLPKKVETKPEPPAAPPKPATFADKIPPTKKVPVPIIKKPQVKEEEQKQAISQVLDEDSVEELQIPTAKRQISSIQAPQAKSFKLPAAEPPKGLGATGGKLLQNAQPPKTGVTGSLIEPNKISIEPLKAEQNMLFSQTTSVFSSGKGKPTLPGDAKKPDEQQKGKQEQPKAGLKPQGTSLFGLPQGGQGGLGGFGGLCGFGGVNLKTDNQKAEQKQKVDEKKDSAKAPLPGAPSTQVTISADAKQAKQQIKPPGVNFFPNLATTGNIFGLNAQSTGLGANIFSKDPKKENAAQSKQQKVETKNEQKVEQPKKEAATVGSKPADSGQQAKKSPSPIIPTFNLAGKSAAPGTQPASPFGNIFGASSPPGAQPSIFGKASEVKKPEEKAQNAANKESSEAQKPKQGAPINQPSVIPPPSPSPFVAAPTIVKSDEQKPPTDEAVQAINAANSLSTPSAPPANIFNPNNNPLQPNNTSPSVAPVAPANTQGGFMNNSFGNTSFAPTAPPVPQFGVGNNKFMNNAATQQNKTGFDPSAASFGFSSNNQKTFSNFSSGEANIFQNANNPGSASQFATQSNMFNQIPSSTPSFNSAVSFGNNNAQGMFNSNANTGNVPQAGNNPFTAPNNNSFGNNPFNNNANNNAFANTGFSNNNANQNFGNTFANNNASTNNPFGNSNSNMFGGNSSNFGNNNSNPMFNNTNNSNNQFGGSGMFPNNSNQGNFLQKLGQPNPTAPPAGVSSHLMQMRK